MASNSVHMTLQAMALSAMLATACSNTDPTSSGGKGNEKFTTWGEDYIENQIPPDPTGENGFVDGWTLHYEKFLVNFHGIVVADTAGKVAATLDKPRFADNTKPGRKDLVEFDGLDARAWDNVSWQVKPAVADEAIIAGDPSDLATMVQNGWSIYVQGIATKPTADGKTIQKTFHWGFKTATQYSECHHEENGKDTLGVVVTNGSTDITELTTHGDHLFYDRLQSSPNPEIKTSMRFDEKAAGDEPPYGNGDGDITLEELCKTPIDVTKYDPSGLPAPTIGDFVISLARTVGHYRGEGECTVSAIGAKLTSPCHQGM